MLTDKLLYDPEGASVSPVTFTVIVPGSVVAEPKFNVLNQLPVVIVGAVLPVTVTLGELVGAPLVDPKLYVIADTVNPPVPVQLKLVAFAIDIELLTVIFFEPNTIERVFELLPSIVDNVKLKLPKSKVPCVK
jgi:hypothetical protein